MRSDLRADCARCSALCCFVYDLKTEHGFAVEKAALARCGHLDDDDRCAIHAVRASRGFAGCASYECWGAGQRVTEGWLLGARVDDSVDPISLARAFLAMVSLHEQLALVDTALGLARDPALAADLRAALGRFQSAVSDDIDDVRTIVRALLARVRAERAGLRRTALVVVG